MSAVSGGGWTPDGNLRHRAGAPCPVTGKPIPFGVTFTDHDLPGLFNACAACSDKNFRSLRELNDARAGAATTDGEKE